VEVNKQVKLRLGPNGAYITKSVNAELILKDIQQKRYLTENILEGIDRHLEPNEKMNVGQYDFKFPDNSHQCQFSKSMLEARPRKCILCGKPEDNEIA
jgi:hypothetical protein